MTWTYQLTIPSSLNQQSIRACLRTWLIPKRIQGQLRQTRRIQLNGTPTSIAQLVNTGDCLTLTFIPSDFRTPTSNYIAAATAPATILYQNSDLLVVDKPAGVKSHPNQPGETGSIFK